MSFRLLFTRLLVFVFAHLVSELDGCKETPLRRRWLRTPPTTRARVNPRLAGVWIVTRPAGGGGGAEGPPEISQTTGPISKFQTPFDSSVRELPVQGQTF